MNRKVTMAGVESSEGRKGHEEKAIRMTLEFPYARQLGKGRAFFFFLIWREFCFIMGFPSATVLKNLPEVNTTLRLSSDQFYVVYNGFKTMGRG